MLFFMKTLRRVLIVFLLILTTVQLAACGVATPAPTAAVTTLPSFTPSVISTSTKPPPTPSVTPAPTVSELPVSAPPDGLLMAYIIKGNLYFQEGSKPPLKLTNSGEDSSPIFSDDGKKIAFNRGANPSNIYTINVDGSGEQEIVTTSQLMNLDSGYDKSTVASYATFVPETHRLLFTTYQYVDGTFVANGDLLSVDADTTKIKRLSDYGSDFYVSPNGKFIAISTAGQIDMIDTEGNIIRDKLLTYTPSQPSFRPPGIFWTSDSAELIILLTVQTFVDVGDIPIYRIWRYSLESGTGVDVLLDPLPMEVDMPTVSPDGNWVLYNNTDQYAFYLGNLSTGHVEPYEPKYTVYHYPQYWNKDSKHFIYSFGQLYLGSVDGSPASFIGDGDFLGWIDSARFLYYADKDKNIVMGDIKGSQEIIFADRESFKNSGFFTFILPEVRNQ